MFVFPCNLKTLLRFFILVMFSTGLFCLGSCQDPDLNLGVRVLNFRYASGLLQHARIFQSLISRANLVESESATVSVNLHLEFFYAHLRTTAKHNFLVMHPDVQRFEPLEYIDLVICLTERCVELAGKLRAERKFGYKIFRTSFTSEVEQTDAVRDFGKVVHFAGKSPYKNTRAVVEAWLAHPEFPKLEVSCYFACEEQHLKGIDKSKLKLAKNLVVHTHPLEKEKFDALMNSAGIFVVPSSMEGWGHYMHEGRGRGAVLITTDKGPMNEFVKDGISGFLVRCDKEIEHNTLTHETNCVVESSDLAEVVKKALALSSDEKQAMGKAAKYGFEADTKKFEEDMKRLLSSLYKYGSLKGIESELL